MGHRPTASEAASRPAGRRIVLLFLAKFIGLIILAYALTTTSKFQEVLFPTFLEWNAQLGAIVLNAIGQNVQRSELTLISPDFALQVRRGCDAVEPIMLFAAAVLAFPARWRARCVGLVAGIAALIMLNTVRIVTLFLIGVYSPTTFAMAHVEIWQTLFVLLTMMLWSTWAWWTTKKPTRVKHAAA